MAALSCGVSCATVRAAADIWISTSSGLWSTPGNWSGGVEPSSTSTVTFDNATGLSTSITLVSAAAAKSLTFAATGGAAYTFDTAGTLNVDTLTLSAGITNSDTATQAFYNAINASATQTWAATTGGLSFYGNVSIGSGATAATLTVNGADAVLFSGVISNGGTAAGSLKYSGNSVLTLSGTNTYTGTTSVESGATIAVDSSNALGSGASAVTVSSGGTVELTGSLNLANAFTATGTGVSTEGALYNAAGSNTISGNIDQSGATTYGAAAGTQLTISGVISGAAANFGTGAETGTIVLTGNNTYTGATTVAVGTVIAESSTSLGTGAATVTSGATLGFEGGVTDSKAVTVNGAGVSGSAGALESLSGTNTVSGNVTLASAATLGAASGQTLDIGGTLATKTFGLTLGNAVGTGTVDITGQITGTTGTLTAADGTTVISSATANTYAGATVVDSGATLVAAANTALGTVAGATTVDSGGTLGFEGSIAYSTAEPVTLNGTGVGGAGALENISGTNSFAGPLTLGSNSTIAAAAGSQLTLSGTVALGGFNLALGSGSSTGTIDGSGVVSGTGNITVASGTALLGNTANTFVGTTQVDSGATVQLAAAGSLGGSSNAVVLDGGTLQATGTVSLAATHGITLTAGGGGGTIDTQGNAVTVSGVIAGTGSDPLTKAGTGTLTLGGANTYVGATNVNAGTLAFSASNSLNNASLLTIASGATVSLAGFSQSVGALAGAGTLAMGTGGSLTLTSGSGLFSGSFTGSGSLTLNSGSTLVLGASMSASAVNLTLAGGSLMLNGTTSTFGTLTLTGNSVIDFASPSASVLNLTNLNLNGYSLMVNDWENGVDYFYTQGFTGATLDAKGTAPEDLITFQGYTPSTTVWQSGDFQITPAPEPAAYGALFAAISLGSVCALRRRQERPPLAAGTRAG